MGFSRGRRAAMLCWLAVVACHRGAPGPSAPGVAEPDPAPGFRLQYSNPGGMWLPGQMLLPAHVQTLRSMGVKFDARKLADLGSAPLNAIVWLGGCTGSFVSPDGLIATNHHCVQDVLWAGTDVHGGQNLLEDGFVAKTRADEKFAGPMPRAFVTLSVKDVTNEMRGELHKFKDPIARKLDLERHLKRLLEVCQGQRTGIRCSIKPYFGGAVYLQTESLELRDVRLVYAPARSVGYYGGEVANWRWPRHAGEWAFYRAYVGKRGTPADYSPENVPFHPKSRLQVTTAGVKPGDFVMIAGYPGYTNRTTTAANLHFEAESVLPDQIARAKERYAIVQAHVADPTATSAKAIVLTQELQNDIAKDEGVLAGLTTTDRLAQKDALDHAIKDWAAKPGREAYKLAIERLEAIDAESRRTARSDHARRAAFAGSSLLLAALTVTRWCEERTRPSADRRYGFEDSYQIDAIVRLRQLIAFYDRTLDHAMFRRTLVDALALPENDRPWLATLLGVDPGTPIDEAQIDAALDTWYRSPQIEDDYFRTALLTSSTPAELDASSDPFIQAAQRISPIVRAERKATDARDGGHLLVLPLYVSAMKDVLGGALAPDANVSLRVTYGTIKSFKPESKDPADRPISTASQILALDTGKEPFNAPRKLLAAIKARTYGRYADPALGGDLPIDFLSDLDITSGNSGSPTLDDKGELVGIAFDGTLEGAASDAVFDPATTRTISVDARYMLWTMDLLDGADHLIEEMELTPTLP